MFLVTGDIIKKLFLIIIIFSLIFLFANVFQKANTLSVFNLQANTTKALDFNKQRLIDQFVPIQLNVNNYKGILQQALPVLGNNQNQRPLSHLIDHPLLLINLVSDFLIDVKINNPVNIFNSELPVRLSVKQNSVQTISSELFPKRNKKQKNSKQKKSNEKRQASSNPNLKFSQTEQSQEVKKFYRKTLVGVYHTHTSESYGVSVFNGHSSPGTRGEIVEVGEELINTLKFKHGIRGIQSTKVNDAVYRRSYIQSRQVGKGLVKENPNLKMVFDIHRDALAKKDKDAVTTTINGQKVAKIMILVARPGSNYDLSHPTWKKNLKFARKLANEIHIRYPGLLRKKEVKVVDNRRYNQDIHPHALLLEIGGVSNTLLEAKRSARLVANAIASLLAKQVNG